MLWALALPPLAGTFRRHWHARTPASVQREVVRSAVVLAILTATLAVVPHLIAPAPDFIPGRHPKILAVTTLGLLVTLIAAVTIWLIRGRADALGRSPAIAKSELQTYLRLRSDLEWLLGFLGVVVGLAYWPARSSGTSTCPMTTRRSSGTSGVVLCGLVLSLLVALIYLPTWSPSRAPAHAFVTAPRSCWS